MTNSVTKTQFGSETAPSDDRVGIVPSSARISSPRLAAVEWLRLLAIAAVVFLHLDAGPLWMAMAGVMCFVSLMTAFTASSTLRRNPTELISLRAQRLLVPWFLWSGVYAVAKMADAVVKHEPLTTLYEPWMLFAGSSLHLWFLPWAFVVCVVVGVWFAQRKFYHQSESAWWGCILLAICLYIVSTHVYPILHRNGISPPHLWILYTPAVAVGLALARIPPGVSTSTPKLIALVSGIGLAGTEAVMYGHATVAIAMTLSAFLCALAWHIPLVAGSMTVRLGSMSYGIYIVHLLVARILSRLVPGMDGEGRALIVLILSGLFVALLQQTPLRRVI